MRQDRILALVLIAICVIAAMGNWLGSGRPSSTEVSVRRSADWNRSVSAIKADVALIPIRGVIESATGSTFGESSPSADTVVKAIRRARNDQVQAILMPINSPGGTAAASEAIYNELMRIRQETKIKIVASMGDVAASGGYFVASAAHHIVASPSTLTGSIGVILRSSKVTGLLKTIGVETETIKSGQYKDIFSPFRDTTPGERTLLEGIVEDTYQHFLTAIVAGRKISLEQLKPLADGRVFTGAQALKVKLVDSLGNASDALDKVTELAQIKGEPTVRNYLVPSFADYFTPFFSASLEHLIPGYQQAKLSLWNKIPLTLME
jgi:protease-4